MKLTEREEQKRQAHNLLYAPLQEEPIDLDQIFQVMVESLRYHYAGYEQKKRYFTPSEYRTYILSRHRYNTLSFRMLARSLHQFAADMHDRNLRFSCDDWIDYRNTDVRFRVRAQEDCLWVTEAAAETGLVPGDKILTVNRMTPEQIRHYLRYNGFYSRVPERELWGGYLRMADDVEVEHANGSRETRALLQFEPEEHEWPILFSAPAEGVVCLRPERMDSASMEQLLEAREAEIASCRKLILDLRRCVGGDEEACWPLLPYLVDRPRMLSELLADEGRYVNCSTVNCELRYRILSDAREGASDAEQRALLDEERRFYLENYGRGLVYREALPLDDVLIEPAAKAPEQVVLLTDAFCENEGEQFAAMCRRCGGKVFTLGRPTMGTLDFFDPIIVSLNDHMRLSYPIAMSKAAFEGRGIAEKGLPVDRYIPWSPAEIREDLLLQAALSLN